MSAPPFLASSAATDRPTLDDRSFEATQRRTARIAGALYLAAGDQDEAARTREQVRAFQVHAGVFAAGMVVMFSVNLLTNLTAGIVGHWWAWWSAWALIGWGTGIAVHGLVLRLTLWNRDGPHRPIG